MSHVVPMPVIFQPFRKNLVHERCLRLFHTFNFLRFIQLVNAARDNLERIPDFFVSHESNLRFVADTKVNISAHFTEELQLHYVNEN